MWSLLLAAALAAQNANFVVDVPNFRSLDGRQQELFESVANQEFCGCDSGLTLLRCLQERPRCKLAGEVGRVLVRASGSGASRANVSMFVSQGVLGPFCAGAQNVTVPRAPRKGAATAPLQVVEFFDYRCTHCKAAMPHVEAGLAAFKGQAALTLVPVALVEHSPSQVAAEAALAAQAQNKFWPMHEALFAAGEAAYTPSGVRALAKKVGLAMGRFEQDMQAHAHAAQAKAHRQAFLGLGLDGTPAMFVNGRRFDLEPKAFDLRDRLRLETLRDGSGCQ